MDNTATARDLQHRHDHQRRDWHEPLEEPYKLAKDDLDVLHSPVAGHGWRLISICENYIATCSCGWRGAETEYMVLALRQVKDHLDAAEQGRRRRLSPSTTPAPRERVRDTNQHEAVAPARELGASAQSQQNRLVQALERSSDLPSGSGEHLGHREAMPRHAKIRAPEQTPRGLQRQLDQITELRKRIAAAAAALAVIEDEAARVHRDLAARRPSSAAEYLRVADEATKSVTQPPQTQAAPEHCLEACVSTPSPDTVTGTVLADRSNHLFARLWRLISTATGAVTPAVRLW
jgi:hypothetical protein